MTGYSGTPLAQKLGIKAEQKVVTIGAPTRYAKLLSPLPKRVSFTKKIETGAAFIHLFVSERKNTGGGNEATPEIDCGHWNPLGFVAEEIFGRRDRCDGRCDPRSGVAARVCRRESLRGGRHLV